MAERLRVGAPVLEVRGLNVYYGASHALQGVDLAIDAGVLSVVGRNGMGKTTLCKAIMGLVPVASGTIAFNGQPLVGRSPTEIARLGIGYVPQGRRLWRSLTVDEHLRMVAAGHAGAWTPERVYATFPRLGERRGNGGGQLSGGEQQMLAIARALLTNPRLLVMDEPSEGLAPRIIETLIETFKQLEQEGLAILLIEQNLGVATEIAERQLVMVAGEIATETTAEVLIADAELQRRYLGVEPLAHE